MQKPMIARLSRTKRILSAVIAAVTFLSPLTSGLLSSRSAIAETGSADALPTPDEIAQMRAEQQRPRSVILFDAKQFDKFVGFYQMQRNPNVFFTIFRDGDHFMTRLTGQLNVEVYPESPTKFFATLVAAQISFNLDGQGNVTGLVLHQNGYEQPAKKVPESVAKTAEAAIEQRIKSNTPSPGTEAYVRDFIDGMQKGKPNYDGMIPYLAALQRRVEYIDVHRIQSLGSLKSLTFAHVNLVGMDVYNATFELARADFSVSPPTQDGKISSFGWRVIESTDPVVLQRIKDNKPTLGTEEALRHQVEALEKNGRPDYEAMTPSLAAIVRRQEDNPSDLIKKWGPLKSITFKTIGQPMGNEVYDIQFEHALVSAVISPLTPDGKIPGLSFSDTGGPIFNLP